MARTDKQKMSAKVRRVLDKLDLELCGRGPSRLNSEERAALWDVLAAVRGPDYESSDHKWAVTCPIRRAAFPKLAGRWDGGISEVSASFNRPALDDAAMRARVAGVVDSHFARHGMRAFTVLGLDWNKDTDR